MKKMIHIRLPAKLRTKLRIHALKVGTPYGSVVEDAIRLYFKLYSADKEKLEKYLKKSAPRSKPCPGLGDLESNLGADQTEKEIK